VGGERAVDFLGHGISEPLVANHDDGFQVVGLGSEEFPLLRSQYWRGRSIHTAILPEEFGRIVKRSAKTHIWHQRHVNDHYVQMATKAGYRSRAAFKLMEILDKDRLLHRGIRVVDLGSAPGGWSQVVSERLQGHGHVLAIDLLPMEPVKGVEFLQGDFSSAAVLDDFTARLGGHPVDLVLSDIAPNLTGVMLSDQAKSYALAEMALDFAQSVLRPEGAFLIKVFQGAGFEDYLRQMRGVFKAVTSRKPKASRDESTEVYLLGRGLRH
jgi:23S rRNA (uridine2552-2'-O)-methyltransferase